jgi:tRNA nucleotidyltransferase (CCA-adding enzyme)
MVEIYLVGGAVRDMYLGRPTKDYDFSVEAESYDHMKEWLFENDFEIFTESEENFTVRARRLGPWHFAGIEMTNLTFDFVLCRKDGEYSDGRRPDSVEMGTLYDDLARRDFTINAMALNKHGRLIDPHGGGLDLVRRVIRCVGSTDRLTEDSLRAFRALRFAVTLDFTLDNSIWEHLATMSVDVLKNAHEDRIRKELTKAFAHDSVKTLYLLVGFPNLVEYVFKQTNLWLEPTSKKVK